MQESDPLEQLYDAHAQAIFAFLIRFLKDESDVRDVMQDLFCRIASHPNLLNDARNKRAFLIKMAHRQAIDAIRRRDARTRAHHGLSELATSWTEQSPVSDESIIQDRLALAAENLPDDQATVIHLRLKEDMSFDQIAKTLEISPNTAASRYRYGINKLQTLLKPLYEEFK